MARSLIDRIRRRVKHEFKERIVLPVKSHNKQKIFCIGQNKTGTTSLLNAFQELKFVTATETESAKFLDAYLANDFISIANYCKRAQVFEDVPFSLPETYKYLDKAFPDSKFILTIRDNPDKWYNSLVRFLSKLFGKGSIPTKEDFQNARYIEKGWAWKLFSTYKTPENDLFNKEILIAAYEKHNEEVIRYFEGRNCLLVLNLNEEGSYQKFCNFLHIKSDRKDFPWVHKTETMAIRS